MCVCVCVCEELLYSPSTQCLCRSGRPRCNRTSRCICEHQDWSCYRWRSGGTRPYSDEDTNHTVTLLSVSRFRFRDLRNCCAVPYLSTEVDHGTRLASSGVALAANARCLEARQCHFSSRLRNILYVSLKKIEIIQKDTREKADKQVGTDGSVNTDG